MRPVLLQVSTVDTNPILEGHPFAIQCLLFALIVLALGVLAIIIRFKGDDT